jgi:ABC-type sugar transport system ATPase subunit
VEAMTMADRIAVMKDGHLQAYCTPDELYDQPQTLFIAGFVGNPPMNFVDVDVTGEASTYYATAQGLRAEIAPARGQKAAGRGRVIMGIRPEDVMLSRNEEMGASPGVVYLVEPLGRDDLVAVRLGDIELHALTDPALNLAMDEKVWIQINPERVQFFDPQTELSLLWR